MHYFVASKLSKLTCWHIYIAHNFVSVSGLGNDGHGHRKTSFRSEEAHRAWILRDQDTTITTNHPTPIIRHDIYDHIIIYIYHDYATTVATLPSLMGQLMSSQFERFTRAIRLATLGVSSIQQCLWMQFMCCHQILHCRLDIDISK